MKIIRVLNNSAVISENQDHEEIIALGKGIAYGKKYMTIKEILVIAHLFKENRVRSSN